MCGYSVRGLVSAVCPECGADLGAADGVVLVGTRRWDVFVGDVIVAAIAYAFLFAIALVVVSSLLPVVHHQTGRLYATYSKSGAFSETFRMHFSAKRTLPGVLTFGRQEWQKIDLTVTDRVAYPDALRLKVDVRDGRLVDREDGTVVDWNYFEDWLGRAGFVLGNDRAVAEAKALLRVMEAGDNSVEHDLLAEYFSDYSYAGMQHSRRPVYRYQWLVSRVVVMVLMLALWGRRVVKAYYACRDVQTSLCLPVTREG